MSNYNLEVIGLLMAENADLLNPLWIKAKKFSDSLVNDIYPYVIRVEGDGKKNKDVYRVVKNTIRYVTETSDTICRKILDVQSLANLKGLDEPFPLLSAEPTAVEVMRCLTHKRAAEILEDDLLVRLEKIAMM